MITVVTAVKDSNDNNYSKDKSSNSHLLGMTVNVGSNKSVILKDKTGALVTMIKTLKYDKCVQSMQASNSQGKTKNHVIYRLTHSSRLQLTQPAINALSHQSTHSSTNQLTQPRINSLSH